MVKMPHTPSRLRATTRKPDTAPPRIADLDRLDEAVPRGGRGADVRLDADVHADDARGHRCRGADEEGDAGHRRDRQARPSDGTSATSGVSTTADDHADDHGAGKSQAAPIVVY